MAVLDTGIDSNHPDIQGAITSSKDFTGDGIKDKNGHGTHCSGIIAARKNDVGYVGVAPQCSLLIAKVLDNNGRGLYLNIVKGVNWAVESGADIISV